MVDVLDAIGAIDAATIALLKPGVSGAKVYQHPPKDAPLPLVIVGDMENVRKLGGKGARPDRGVPLSIVVVTEGMERAPCSSLVAQVEQLLDGVSITVGGFRITYHHDQSAAMLEPESGAGYVGLGQFHVFAIPA